MNTKVSVLMPIYRTQESYLRTAIESILNQTYSEFEFLILDDCPDDDREEIVKSYNDPRIIYVKNDKNLGITQSRNKLIEMASGDYLATMDHDDISLPTRFEKQVAHLDAHTSVGVVGCRTETFPNYIDLYHPETDEEIKAGLTCRCAILHPASMIRKSVLIDNNIRYEERYSPAEDYRLWLRLMECTDFYNIPEVLFRYRHHNHNTTNRQIDKMFYASEELHYLAQKQHPELYEKFKRNTRYSVKIFNRFKKIVSKQSVCRFFKNPKTITVQSDFVLKKPILVHLHIFYPDLWLELKSYIQNISPYPFDLYVTMVEQNSDIENDIQSTFPNAHIEIVENRGYDIGPFIHTLNKIDLNKYDFVIKLHTKGTKSKNTKKFRGLSGNQWRLELLSFLKDHKTLTRYLYSFENTDLGMTGGYKCLVSKDYQAGEKCIQRLARFLINHKLNYRPFTFIGGSMFLCRSNVLRPIKNLQLKLTDFEEATAGGYTLAHVMERLFGFYTSFIGYKCDNYVVPRLKQTLFLKYEEEIVRRFDLLKYDIHQKLSLKKNKISKDVHSGERKEK